MNPYIANTSDDEAAMLAAIGVRSVDDLFVDIKPRHAPRSFNLPTGKAEAEAVGELSRLAAQNSVEVVPFLGAGYYDHYIPQAVKSLASRGEFVTAYTPYQPECAQGTLQSLYEFQSSIATLTEMDVANASLYDGGTALYEAAMMALRLTGRNRIVVDSGVNPIHRKILRSYTQGRSIALAETPSEIAPCDRKSVEKMLTKETAAVIVQNPNFFGMVDDVIDLVEAAHAKGVLVIMSVYPMALGLVKTPGEMGADIVVGEGQSLGLPLNFGGPYLGLIATRKKFVRQMPGRIVGKTVDREGRVCFVNTLQAREQHIRREKATSNICTNVALCAIQAAIFMAIVGRDGLKNLAQLNLDKAEYAKKVLGAVPGVTVVGKTPTFNEFVIKFSKPVDPVVSSLLKQGIAAGFPLGRYYQGCDDHLLVAVTEKRTKEEIDQFAKLLAVALKGK